MSRDVESIDLQLIGNRLQQENIQGLAYDITISHADNIDISFEFSNDVMFADFVTNGKATQILVINPQESLIFSTDSEFEIESVKVAYRDSYIEYNITEIPQEFSVHTYPNPFNPVLNVEYSLPYENYVNISIFDINGQKVFELDEGMQNAGIHNVQWEAVNISSGLYFLKIESGQFNKIEKIMLVK